MNKMNSESANKIFKGINDKWDDFISITYGVGNPAIKFYYNVSAVDKAKITDIVSGVCMPEDSYEPLKVKSILARCIIEYLTDLPIPTTTIETEDGSEEIEDYMVCYHIVYGVGGLIYESETVAELVDELEGYVEDVIYEHLEKNDPVRRLAARIMELGQEFSAAMEDMVSDPDSPLNEAIASAVEDLKGSVN